MGVRMASRQCVAEKWGAIIQIMCIGPYLGMFRLAHGTARGTVVSLTCCGALEIQSLFDFISRKGRCCLSFRQHVQNVQKHARKTKHPVLHHKRTRGRHVHEHTLLRLAAPRSILTLSIRSLRLNGIVHVQFCLSIHPRIHKVQAPLLCRCMSLE